MMKRAEMEAHLKSGGRLGFFCDDAFCEAWLAEDGVHLSIQPAEENVEPMELVGDFDKLYEMQVDLELSLFPTADRRQ